MLNRMMMGTAGGPTFDTTWNPLDKHANITLSNGDLTAAKTDGIGHFCVRATVSHDSGKWYYEVRVDIAAAGGNWIVGVGNSSASLSVFIGNDVNGWSYGNSGNKNHSGFSSYGDAYVATEIIAVAVDIDGGSINFWNENVDQGVAFSSQTFGTIFPMWNGWEAGGAFDTCTARFNSTDQTHSPPSGYSPWDNK